MGRVVAIDYGKAKIGLAMTDESQKIALPFKTIQAGKTLSQTAKIILEEFSPFLSKIEKFVLGLPLLLSGKKGEMAKEVEAFKQALETMTNIPIDFWDERLTSAQAEARLKECSLSRKKRAQCSDTVSAMIILENYLAALPEVKC
jgi:putative holliday junction resolvase